jgi:hypothetical protein
LKLNLKGRHAQYIGEKPPEFATNRLDLTAFRDPAYTFVLITSEETGDGMDKPGYYLLDGVDPSEAINWV